MKYLNKSFSIGTENSAAYRDNYDRIFGKKSKPEKQPEIERCRECGSWEAQCSAPGPVPGCACARCLRATLVAAELRDRLNYERAEKAEKERDEYRALYEAVSGTSKRDIAERQREACVRAVESLIERRWPDLGDRPSSPPAAVLDALTRVSASPLVTDEACGTCDFCRDGQGCRCVAEREEP